MGHKAAFEQKQNKHTYTHSLNPSPSLDDDRQDQLRLVCLHLYFPLFLSAVLLLFLDRCNKTRMSLHDDSSRNVRHDKQ